MLGERITAGHVRHVRVGLDPRRDPDYILSIFTCDKRSGDNDGGTILRNTSDSFYCDPAFDQKYVQQGRDRQRRPSGPGRADAAADLRRRALRADVLLRQPARRTAATGSPTSRRSPTPAARCSSSSARGRTSRSDRWALTTRTAPRRGGRGPRTGASSSPSWLGCWCSSASSCSSAVDGRRSAADDRE